VASFAQQASSSDKKKMCCQCNKIGHVSGNHPEIMDGEESKRSGSDDNHGVGSGGGKGFGFSQVSEVDVKWQKAMGVGWNDSLHF